MSTQVIHVIKVFGLPALLMLILLVACSRDEPLGPAPALALSTQLIAINDDETVTATLAPKPNGIATWEVVDKPSWLVVSPMSGTLSGPVELEFTRDENVTLSAGTYSGELTIMSTAASGEVTAAVSLTIAAKPEIEISAQTLTLTTDENSKSFTIKNIGTGKLNWEITSDKSWTAADVTSGFLMDGESKIVNIQVGKDTLMAGLQTATLTIASNSTTGANKTIGLNVSVPEYAYINASVDSLGINYFEQSRKFKIYNAGNVAYNWSAGFDQTYFTVSPSSGTLQFRDSVEVTVSSVRTDLATGDFTAMLTIQNNKAESFEVKSTLRNYVEEKWLLTDVIVDAEYDDNNDVIIAVNSDLILKKLNPVSATSSQVTLNKVPTCVSVSQDGTFAVVGHDGMISYVNLSTMTVQAEYTVSCDAIDVVLAPNGYAYVFPKADQWETIRCINLTNGNETQHTGSGIYAGTRARLHPNGQAIYGANRGLSPSDFEKYDISPGTAEFLYDSPYHGDYAFSGNIWISENGDLLFARSGNVFKSTTVQETDMIYAGNIAGNSRWVMALDHSTEKNRAYAVFTTGEFYDEIPSHEVSVFDGTYLTAKGTIPLPYYMEADGNGGGTLRLSRGYFGFFNANGSKFYVITKNSGAAADYAIVTLDTTL